MTNEEKAKELFPICQLWAPIVSKSIREKILEMAEWKDQQFKEYLEMKIAECNGTSRSAWEVYDEIINELFKED